MVEVFSSGSRTEMGGARCKIFSHDPMSGLVWYVFSYAKGEKLGPGGAWPPWLPPGSATGIIPINKT